MCNNPHEDLEWPASSSPLYRHFIREALPYLPTDTVTTEEGKFKPPPPIICHLGPFGNQRRVEINMFDVHKMCKLYPSPSHPFVTPSNTLPGEFIPESKAHIFSAGAPVWGLDWCPIHPVDRPCSYNPIPTSCQSETHDPHLQTAPMRNI
jgi:hypothetical protein